MTPVYHGQKLSHGNVLNGPVIIELPNTTVSFDQDKALSKILLWFHPCRW